MFFNSIINYRKSEDKKSERMANQEYGTIFYFANKNERKQ